MTAINSMTGYGSAEGHFNGVDYAVEIRAVNNRYFKVKIKIPEATAFLEEDVEKLLRQNIARGMVNYTLRLKNAPADMLFNVDGSALQTIVERLNKISDSVKIKCSIDLAQLLTLPGMLTQLTLKEEVAAQVKEKILGLTQEALAKLMQMRKAEGQAMADDLISYCGAISSNLERIRERSLVVPDEYAKKLKQKADALLVDSKFDLDEATLTREIAVLAERSDTSEEIARLDSHLQQVTDNCHKGAGQMGRRLDFLAQEMLREANTIASKALDTEIIHLVVDMKCQIERIKEQVQNVE